MRDISISFLTHNIYHSIHECFVTLQYFDAKSSEIQVHMHLRWNPKYLFCCLICYAAAFVAWNLPSFPNSSYLKYSTSNSIMYANVIINWPYLFLRKTKPLCKFLFEPVRCTWSCSCSILDIIITSCLALPKMEILGLTSKSQLFFHL